MGEVDHSFRDAEKCEKWARNLTPVERIYWQMKAMRPKDWGALSTKLGIKESRSRKLFRWPWLVIKFMLALILTVVFSLYFIPRKLSNK